MIFDCFIYFNEIELLELRLKTLGEIVDYFVIVEADKTFAGRSREFHFAQHQHQFAEYADKIVYVQVRDMPQSSDPWEREWHQRNCIMRGLADCQANDLILISDADEIPKPETLLRLCQMEKGQDVLQKHPVAFAQHNFYYFVNCVEKKFWHGTVAVRYGNLSLPQTLRNNRERMPRIRDGGWHFSYLGGVERVIEKIQSYSHQELNTPQNNSPEHIRHCIEAGLSDIHNNNRIKYSFVPIDDSYPAYMSVLLAKYPGIYFSSEQALTDQDAYPTRSGSIFYNYLRWYWFLAKSRIKSVFCEGKAI